jgi:hypothetical protein
LITGTASGLRSAISAYTQQFSLLISKIAGNNSPAGKISWTAVSFTY